MARSLYGLRRKSSILKQLFTVSDPLAEFLATEVPGDPIAQDALDMYQRIKTLADDLNERVTGLINLNLAIAGQRNNDVMRFLTVYSAFFMPLTFLVGVYGMNFKFMPELDKPWAYTLIWIVMLCITGLHFWWFRRKRWL
jgi:magnesium transporter